ncbi:dual specificity protein phosphatase family protein [Sphingobium estronivorans]|uniref:dual specificity protein phosphatase family protein n=1 Tax=Sphingobium estronivorans TaxID=1577690 RepID=UPI00123A0182|nr:dual specificity protein phosphatase family protein [Sphingobium estronivorans]
MLVMFVGADRTETAVNATQVTFVSSITDGTRIRFGEGRSVTVVEPIAEVMERLNVALRPHD